MEVTPSGGLAADRVREQSAPQVNAQLDAEMAARVRAYAGRGDEAITQRIGELEREWDMERTLETNASILAGLGLLLGATVNRRWLLFTGVVLSFLFQHAIQGWCPPIELFRRLGVRTQREIEREKQALKLLRGDAASLAQAGDNAARAAAALRAVSR